MIRLPFALLLLAGAAPAFAQQQQDAAAPAGGGSGPSVSGDAFLLSDYRFRGVSRSDDAPAVQGQLTLSLPDGLYAGARATSLRRFAGHGDAEADLYAGYGRDIAPGTTLDAGVMLYWFPDAKGRTGYFEPYASVSHTLGPVEATVGAKYAWSQRAIGRDDMLYLFGQVEAGIPKTPVTLTAEAGRQESGALGNYWNWSVGGRYSFRHFEAGLHYVDTDLARHGAGATLVASVGLRF
ncbi:MAG TPA: TorF family putative porin [Allosphingosinicella sp.]|nr:TorF family putative porin [Allosphingosinicella sp.]